LGTGARSIGSFNGKFSGEDVGELGAIAVAAT